jgi:hypothetical protein
MRFIAGVCVGIVIGKPVLDVVNKHLTPPVRKKIIQTVTTLADRINAWVLSQEQEVKS